VRLFVAVAFVGLAACSSKAKLAAQGGECLQATDCQDGLVCVPQKNAPSVCSNDLSGVQSTEEAGAPAARDATVRDAPSDAPARDTGQPADADQPDTGGEATDAATE
jgi:hypothetical protein